MSSRALRKAQRELEEKRRQEESEIAETGSQSESSEEPVTKTAPKPSLFALLGDDDGNDEVDEETDEPPSSSQDGRQEDPASSENISNMPAKTPGKSKKKKKKKKSSQSSAKPTASSQSKFAGSSLSELDEIDRALQELSAGNSKTDRAAQTSSGMSSASLESWKALSIDSQHLHAANEMRRLFGRVALEPGNEDQEGGNARRRAQGAHQVGIAGAVAGRNQRGRGLASIGLRRNIFIQGKDEWPRGTSGGLGMEVVEKRSDGTIEYRFVHNSAYQDVQRQFQTCVSSMDPNRMVQLLQYNPYHTSTLLQVSEIAKQERDHATSGDLLERALFSFGRSTHTSFPGSLSQGTSRLDFRRPENREFWLAAWRYIGNLGMRATWRTAFEWAKLLLGLDPEGDPYCVALVLDQFALRARQPQQLVSLWKSSLFSSKWESLPNMALSIGLAYVQAGEAIVGREHLRNAIEKYPWVAYRMFQELEIDTVPPNIWGSMPNTSEDKLFTELYVVRAKDLWNTPEATSLFVEVAFTADPSKSEPAAKIFLDKLNYTRHTILTDNPALIKYLDRSLTSKLRSVSDPLPPANNLQSYNPSQNAQRSSGNNSNEAVMLQEYSTLQAFFRSLLPWVNASGDPIEPQTGQAPTEEDVERRIRESGVPTETIVERTERLQELHAALVQMAGEREQADDDHEPNEERQD